MEFFITVALVIVAFVGGCYCGKKYAAQAAAVLTQAETVVADAKKI